jgi:hypothetical protein
MGAISMFSLLFTLPPRNFALLCALCVCGQLLLRDRHAMKGVLLTNILLDLESMFGDSAIRGDLFQICYFRTIISYLFKEFPQSG